MTEKFSFPNPRLHVQAYAEILMMEDTPEHIVEEAAIELRKLVLRREVAVKFGDDGFKP